MLAASLAECPEFGTVFEVVLLVVGFAGGISVDFLFVLEILVVLGMCLPCEKLLHLNCLPLTRYMQGGREGDSVNEPGYHSFFNKDMRVYKCNDK